MRQRPGDELGNRADRDAELPGDGFVGHVLEPVQGEGFAGARRQIADGDEDAGGLLAADEDALGREALGQLERVVERALREVLTLGSRLAAMRKR